MLILISLAIIAGLMAHWSPLYWNGKERTFDFAVLGKSLAKSIVFVIPLFVLEAVVWSSFVIIPPGHRGVVFNKFSGVRSAALKEGFNTVLPILDDVSIYDTRIQKVEFDATAASKDLQSVSTKVALNFRPHADSVAEIHRSVGVGYAEKIVHPAVQEPQYGRCAALSPSTVDPVVGRAP